MNLRDHVRSLRAVLPKVGRLLGFLAVVYAVTLVFAARSASAEVDELMMGLGAEMLRFPDSTQGRVRELRLNGAPIQMMTGVTDKSLDEVLAYFEARCQEHDGGVAETVRGLLEAEGADALGLDARAMDTTLVANYGNRGFVACLDPGERADLRESESLLARARRALESGKIGDLGHLRYLYAERYREGDRRWGTHLVSIFSDDDLDIRRLFPERGDAPGVDPEAVPRAEGLRRILSAHEVGKPYGMTLYTSTDRTADGLASWYRRALTDAGWRPLTARDGERVRIDGQHLVTATLGDRLVTLVVGELDGAATVTVLTSDEEPR
ncbi:MAG: hypothetical protein KF901_26540 [Myxococcales bacterium]|nr:hypothetical protein [Myxococcales bacterium]